MPRIVIEGEGSLAGREHEFDGSLVLGRGSQADYAIDYPGVSRRHAIIEKSGRHWTISDLGSSNGTFVEGRKIVDERARIRHDSEISLGSLKMRFLNEEVEAKPAADYVEGAVQGLRSVDLAVPDLEREQSAEVLRALGRRLSVVNEVGAALSQAVGEEELLQLILQKLFELLPQADRVCILLREEGEDELAPRVSRTRAGEEEPFGISRTLVNEVVDKKKGFFSIDAMQDDRFSSSETVQNLRIRSVVCVPMIGRETVEGAIYVTGGSPTAPFSQDDVSLLAGIAGQAGLAVASSRMRRQLLKRQLLEQDLALARRIQGNFLPNKVPSAEGWEFWDEYDAALGVGGDYYGFFDLPDGRIGIALGDVSGKGISAALYMAKVALEMRTAAASKSQPAEILAIANRSLASGGDEGMFVTAVFVAVDPKSREIEVASAGHPAPFRRARSGEVDALESPGGTPLGVMDDSEYESLKFDLASGDVVFLYTDGVTEAMNPAKEEFGSERLRSVMQNASRGASALGDEVVAQVRQFFDGGAQNDDLTLVSFGPL